jgi:hypothetical protein
METARNFLVGEAAIVMLRASLPDNGQGTVVGKDDVQKFVGLNEGVSRINWTLKTSRSETGSEISDTTQAASSKMIHKHSQDAKDPKVSKDEFTIVGADGKPVLDMKGKCEVAPDGAQNCSYDVSSKLGKGSAHVSTKTTEVLPKINAWSSTSKIDLKLDGADHPLQSAQFKFQASNDVGTYEYNKLKQ